MRDQEQDRPDGAGDGVSRRGEPDGGADLLGEDLVPDRRVFDASPFATLLFTPDLTLITSNAAHAAATGVPGEAIAGRFMFDVWPKNPDQEGPDTEAVIRASVARMMASGAPDEAPVQRHDLPLGDGAFEHRHWRTIHSPVRDAVGAIIAVRQDSWDLSESVRAEERARVHRRTAQAVSGMGFFEADPVAGVITASAETEAMFGYAPGEAGTALDAFLAPIYPDDRPSVERALTEVTSGALHAPVQAEYRVMHPGGIVRHLVSRSELMADGDGGQRLVGGVLDVTPLRRHEAELKAALAQKDVLLDEVNHRVKNSLQLVSSILFMSARTEEDEGVRGKLSAAAARVQAVATVHASLYHTEDVRRMAFGEHLRRFVARMAASGGAEERGIAVEVDAADVDLPTETAVSLSLLVNELFTNAMKHAFAFPDAAGTSRVTVTLRRHGNGTCTLRVADNGPGGVASETAGYDATTPGTGLGSRLVTSLAAQISGKVDVTHDGGRTTRITFPG